jgi:hypothetical protein
MKSRLDDLTASSKSARLRGLMPLINRKINEGVSHADIVNALSEVGLTVSLETFRTNLYRYRREIKGEKPKPETVRNRPYVMGIPDERLALEPPKPAPITTSDDDFEAALDPSRRDEVAAQYINTRRPILGRNKKRTEDK